VSIALEDIQLTYKGQPIRMDATHRASAGALAASALREARATGIQQAQQNFAPDSKHPRLRMTNWDQVLNTEIGGGKPVEWDDYTPQAVRAHRVTKNYLVDGQHEVNIGDYIVQMTDPRTGDVKYPVFSKEIFEQQFSQPNAAVNHLVETTNDILLKENAELRDKLGKFQYLLNRVIDCNRQLTDWFLNKAAEFANLAERSNEGSKELIDVLQR